LWLATDVLRPRSPSAQRTALLASGHALVRSSWSAGGDATGAAVLTRPKVRRASPRPTYAYRRIDDPMAALRLSVPRLAGLIEQMRHGDAAARVARRAPVTVRPSGGVNGATHTRALETLQQALRERSRVWVGYVDAHGAPASRLVRPVSMGSGYLRAEDERTEMLHTFALHRITAAVLEDDEDRPPF